MQPRVPYAHPLIWKCFPEATGLLNSQNHAWHSQPSNIGPVLMCYRCPRWKSDASIRCINTHIEKQCTAKDSSLLGRKMAPEFQVPPMTITASSQEMSLGRDHPCPQRPASCCPVVCVCVCVLVCMYVCVCSCVCVVYACARVCICV